MIASASIALHIPFIDETLPRHRRRQEDMAKPSPPANATTSLELVIRANAGDEVASVALYERYRPRLERWAHNRLPQVARGALQTEDLVQDTLTQVFQHLSAFNPRHEGAF